MLEIFLPWIRHEGRNHTVTAVHRMHCGGYVNVALYSIWLFIIIVMFHVITFIMINMIVI